MIISTVFKNKATGDSVFNKLSLFSALLIFITLIGIVLSLVDGGWPALKAFGPGFIFRDVWDPIHGQFGAAAAIYGKSEAKRS